MIAHAVFTFLFLKQTTRGNFASLFSTSSVKQLKLLQLSSRLFRKRRVAASHVTRDGCSFDLRFHWLSSVIVMHSNTPKRGNLLVFCQIFCFVLEIRVIVAVEASRCNAYVNHGILYSLYQFTRVSWSLILSNRWSPLLICCETGMTLPAAWLKA